MVIELLILIAHVQHNFILKIMFQIVQIVIINVLLVPVKMFVLHVNREELFYLIVCVLMELMMKKEFVQHVIVIVINALVVVQINVLNVKQVLFCRVLFVKVNV